VFRGVRQRSWGSSRAAAVRVVTRIEIDLELVHFIHLGQLGDLVSDTNRGFDRTGRL
jgi:hypothetical protein